MMRAVLPRREKLQRELLGNGMGGLARWTIASMCQNGMASLIGAHLYLPEHWMGDTDRCNKAAIPEDTSIIKASARSHYR